MTKYYYWGPSWNPVDPEEGVEFPYINAWTWEEAAVKAAWELYAYDRGEFSITLQNVLGKQRTITVECDNVWQAKVKGGQR